MAPANQVVRKFSLARVNLIMGAHGVVEKLRQGQGLALARDPKDAFDPNAVFVVARTVRGNVKIGYLTAQLAAEIAPLMDAGVRVIARRAPDARYGVCELAYIPPPPPLPPQAEPIIADLPVEGSDEFGKLPEGVTQEDIDTATEMPPLGDSRRLRTTESPHDDEPAPEAAPDSP